MQASPNILVENNFPVFWLQKIILSFVSASQSLLLFNEVPQKSFISKMQAWAGWRHFQRDGPSILCRVPPSALRDILVPLKILKRRNKYCMQPLIFHVQRNSLRQTKAKQVQMPP